MKKLFVLFVIIVLSGQLGFSQDSGKVLIPNISKSYEGKCKKGLAHGQGEAKGIDTYLGEFKKGLPQGKGTYTWQNGDYYIGEWYKGQRDGEGEFHTRNNSRDTVCAGIWKKDKYIGKKTIQPTVSYKSGVDRYRFKRIGDGNLISIQFKQNGATNTSITSLIIDGDSGTEVENGNYYCFEDFDLPFKCSIRYSTTSKLQQTTCEVRFEFEITQMGNWDLVINN